jgi:hypothetical protein
MQVDLAEQRSTEPLGLLVQASLPMRRAVSQVT